jgi:hypothetical protein
MVQGKIETEGRGPFAYHHPRIIGSRTPAQPREHVRPLRIGRGEHGPSCPSIASMNECNLHIGRLEDWRRGLNLQLPGLWMGAAERREAGGWVVWSGRVLQCVVYVRKR